MLTYEFEAIPPFVREASFPGSAARQYRVQVFSGETRDWQVYANFAHLPQADACWRKLTLDGHQARIIGAQRAPSAA